MWFPRQQFSFLRFSGGATYFSASQPLFLSAPIPQETLNFQYFWVEQDSSVHQIPSCDFRSDRVTPLFPPDSFVWTRQPMAVMDLSRCPDTSATLDRMPRCFHQWLEVLGESQSSADLSVTVANPQLFLRYLEQLMSVSDPHIL